MRVADWLWRALKYSNSIIQTPVTYGVSCAQDDALLRAALCLLFPAPSQCVWLLRLPKYELASNIDARVAAFLSQAAAFLSQGVVNAAKSHDGVGVERRQQQRGHWSE